MSPIIKKLVSLCGIVLVVIGIIGIFLPLLPATPFLILAAICFAKTSPKMHQWLLTNRWCGEYIKNYKEHRGICLRHKLISLSLLWIFITYSILFATKLLWLQVLLIIIALGVTIHILSMATLRRKSQTFKNEDN